MYLFIFLFDGNCVCIICCALFCFCLFVDGGMCFVVVVVILSFHEYINPDLP